MLKTELKNLPPRLFKIKMDVHYNEHLLFSPKEAAEFIALINKAHLYTKDWDDSVTKVAYNLPDNLFTMTPMDMEEYDTILTAQTLGVTLQDYKSELAAKAAGE